jgi:hypothetical protein
MHLPSSFYKRKSGEQVSRHPFFPNGSNYILMRLREFPDPSKRPGKPGDPKSRKHDLNVREDAAARGHHYPSRPEVNNEEPAGETTRPITNNDAQNQITNADNSAQPLGEDEREGA